MKSAFTLFIGISLFSLNAFSDPYDSEYFICRFNQAITAFELNELKQEGFQVFETTTSNHVVYVKAKSDAVFSTKLKAKMNELIKVDKNGNRVYIVETVTEESPEFLKLFFNFI